MTVGIGAAFLTLLISVSFYGAGEYFSKLWGLNPGWPLMAAAVAMYITSSLFWFPALLYKDQLSTIGIVWEVLAIVMTLVMGFIVFREPLTLRHGLGIILAIGAVWLLIR